MSVRCKLLSFFDALLHHIAKREKIVVTLVAVHIVVYEVLAFDDDLVRLYDMQFPLVTAEIPRAEFDRTRWTLT